jgi:hypothetical protein
MCLGYSCIPVDLEQVIEATIDEDALGYISVVLLFASYHRAINPSGGKTTLVRDIPVELGFDEVITFTHSWKASTQCFVPVEPDLVNMYEAFVESGDTLPRKATPLSLVLEAVGRAQTRSIEQWIPGGCFVHLSENAISETNEGHDGMEEPESMHYVEECDGYPNGRDRLDDGVEPWVPGSDLYPVR